MRALSEDIQMMEGVKTGKPMIQPLEVTMLYAKIGSLASIMDTVRREACASLVLCGYMPVSEIKVHFVYSSDMERIRINGEFTVPERIEAESDVPNEYLEAWKEGVALRAEWEKVQMGSSTT